MAPRCPSPSTKSKYDPKVMIGEGMIAPNIHDGRFQKGKTNKANSLLYNMKFSTCGARG